MIKQKNLSLTGGTAQSLNTLFGSTLKFTKIVFGFNGTVQYGDSSLDTSTNPGISVPSTFPNLILEFDPDDDPGNNLFLATSVGSTTISVFVW